MNEYLLLLLDPDCRVLSTISEEGEEATIIKRALSYAREKGAWGYELWHDGRRVAAFYDCNEQPAKKAYPS